jgi:hypothetical protein
MPNVKRKTFFLTFKKLVVYIKMVYLHFLLTVPSLFY